MQKRYLPIAIVTGVLFLIAVGGYIIPASSDGPPIRTLLDNKGGKVILNHASHVQTMQEDCGVCHHTTGNAQNPPACADCHAKKFDETFTAKHQNTLDDALCVSCHHLGATIDNFSHDDHVDDYSEGDCQSCHHDPSIESEPQACSNCHMDGSNSVLNLKKASHTRCADCHDDMYKDGIKGCSNCHTRSTNELEPAQQSCKSCHDTPADQLIPTTMNAFHTQCMGCHEDNGTGPFGDEACYQCHMK
ncbi:cytochrome c [Pseudodesulfovibrio nedwellii]|uniref:Cytochrome c n=1 Tax=Pseudodesulfovibrio nedwellii TaxID=2973072 RepID=A0ABM8AYB9_9BACT|nr:MULTISPECIES: cytochrome c3 family protein [Pseudodesulfovibrio]BDQ36494.1 cytochrome c [Pseudodesulfovibrio nedwellii]